MTVPDQPICRTVDGKAPCPFADRCHESRQLVQSGYSVSLSLGQRVVTHQVMWGEDCWAYQQFTNSLGTEAQQERAAIQAEGA
jgi:hypothetical protein